jgi:hypothetical protein
MSTGYDFEITRLFGTICNSNVAGNSKWMSKRMNGRLIYILHRDSGGLERSRESVAKWWNKKVEYTSRAFAQSLSWKTRDDRSCWLHLELFQEGKKRKENGPAEMKQKGVRRRSVSRNSRSPALYHSTVYIFNKNWTGHWEFFSSRRQLADDEKEWRHLSAASRVSGSPIEFGSVCNLLGFDMIRLADAMLPAGRNCCDDSDLNSIFVGRPRVLA